MFKAAWACMEVVLLFDPTARDTIKVMEPPPTEQMPRDDRPKEAMFATDLLIDSRLEHSMIDLGRDIAPIWTNPQIPDAQTVMVHYSAVLQGAHIRGQPTPAGDSQPGRARGIVAYGGPGHTTPLASNWLVSRKPVLITTWLGRATSCLDHCLTGAGEKNLVWFSPIIRASCLSYMRQVRNIALAPTHWFHRILGWPRTCAQGLERVTATAAPINSNTRVSI
jgi:hypothetical protein